MRSALTWQSCSGWCWQCSIRIVGPNVCALQGAGIIYMPTRRLSMRCVHLSHLCVWMCVDVNCDELQLTMGHGTIRCCRQQRLYGVVRCSYCKLSIHVRLFRPGLLLNIGKASMICSQCHRNRDDTLPLTQLLFSRKIQNSKSITSKELIV